MQKRRISEMEVELGFSENLLLLATPTFSYAEKTMLERRRRRRRRRRNLGFTEKLQF
jgi:hypothetical protein